MKRFNAKLIVLLIAMLLFTVVPLGSVAAENEGVQLIQDENGNVIVYVDGLEETAFDYALSDNAQAEEMDLNYINSVQDDAENQVALIQASELPQSNYLYIRKDDGTVTTIELNKEDLFTKEEMELVETTTNRILTEVLDDAKTDTEVIGDMEYITNRGGLGIADDKNAVYSYQIFDLSNEKYKELQTLANELNSDYGNKTMYSKIEFANKFYNLYSELLGNVEWQPVEDMKIIQPKDAVDGQQYVVMLRKVAEDGTTTYDVKFMTSVRKEIDRMKTEEITTQETSKLPITGDSIVLFVLLAALVIITIVVFIRMKKLNKKADK